MGQHRKTEGGRRTERREYSEIKGANKRTVWTIPTKPFPKAHFATFPPALIEPCILAGTSEKGCCVECGSPWERVVEKSGEFQRRWSKNNADGSPYQKQGSMQNTYQEKGWQPTCKCNAETVPCTVLDPFFGAGTTGIVSYKHGRKFIGIELSETYLDEIAIPRIEKETRQMRLFN